ncbi:Psoralen synthase [Heracleum sosnowskyi]|uniref:Psoralen synthase n=1 Tax=Heracleum sosnowskyi TaxID=360622 RepID=A0AAD8M766_9APIA|nr:Psoralen synthase [Heracleum sosnowskyi]
MTMLLEQHPCFQAFFVLFFVTVFVYRCLFFKKETLKVQPPSPPKFPIIGNLHQLRRDRHITLRSWAQKYGPLMLIHLGIGKKYEGGKGAAFKKLLGQLSELLSYSGVGIYVPWLHWVENFTGFNRRVEKVAKQLDDFLEGVVTDHGVALKNDGAVNQDFVSILLENWKQNTDNSFSIDKDSIKAVTLDMFIAGTNTTSSTLEWTMAMLMKNPDIMSKLQNEVRTIGGGKTKISEDDLEKMHYLKAVIKESMRINTPTPILLREAREDVKVMGYDIKSRTRVFINVWAIARDPALWDKPEEFRPERFLNNLIDYKGLHFEYLPFGAGRRSCPGMRFAMAVNELALANVVNMFDFALPDGKTTEDLDLTGASGIAVGKKSPLMVVANPHF